MELDILQQIYVDKLKDLYSAENRILKALPRMIKAATHKELKQGFTQHERQTRQHARWLERVCKYLGVKPRDKKCVGIEGVLNEASNEFNGSLQLYVQTASLACNGQWLFLVCC